MKTPTVADDGGRYQYSVSEPAQVSLVELGVMKDSNRYTCGWEWTFSIVQQHSGPTSTLYSLHMAFLFPSWNGVELPEYIYNCSQKPHNI